MKNQPTPESKEYCECKNPNYFEGRYVCLNCGKLPTPESKDIPQCFCKSYYDDDGILQDCTCGKCGKPKPESKEDWREIFDHEFADKMHGDFQLVLDLINFIRSEKKKSYEEAIKINRQEEREIYASGYVQAKEELKKEIVGWAEKNAKYMTDSNTPYGMDKYSIGRDDLINFLNK